MRDIVGRNTHRLDTDILMHPKVSIVIPVYNVSQFLRPCLDSVINQTLQDIEIIIVNDGSTDNSLEIAQEYAEKDSRIIIINKANAGYGHTMNRGFERARGEYIGIVESDDIARPEMFEKLYAQAVQNNAEVVRSNYFAMSGNGSAFNVIDVLTLAKAPYYTAFNPADYPGVLLGSPAIWTSIFKNSFIKEHQITFLESPGASYQDTGFLLKVWAAAEKVVFMREAFLNYRVDNANSSVKSGAKVFCVSDEYESFEKFLAKYPKRREALKFQLQAKKYETYLWNYNRLDTPLKPSFRKLMHEQFAAAHDANELDSSLFSPVEWDDLQTVIHNPDSLGDKQLAVAPIELDVREHQKPSR
ncbi:glycosyltransferase family 2 protein [Arcanobacterium hippocoleae]|uniref:glycosyltransferase family 2 protein n=1 Tax=Arcanobacterium hippocoleae TaxID=149017 RepID=UPI003340F507